MRLFCGPRCLRMVVALGLAVALGALQPGCGSAPDKGARDKVAPVAKSPLAGKKPPVHADPEGASKVCAQAAVEVDQLDGIQNPKLGRLVSRCGVALFSEPSCKRAFAAAYKLAAAQVKALAGRKTPPRGEPFSQMADVCRRAYCPHLLDRAKHSLCQYTKGDKLVGGSPKGRAAIQSRFTALRLSILRHEFGDSSRFPRGYKAFQIALTELDKRGLHFREIFLPNELGKVVTTLTFTGGAKDVELVLAGKPALRWKLPTVPKPAQYAPIIKAIDSRSQGRGVALKLVGKVDLNVVTGLVRASYLRLFRLGWAYAPKTFAAVKSSLVCAQAGPTKPATSRSASVTEVKVTPEGIYHGAKLLAPVKKGLLDANTLRDGADGYFIEPVFKVFNKHPSKVVVVSLKGVTSLRVWLSLQGTLGAAKKRMRLGRCL